MLVKIRGTKFQITGGNINWTVVEMKTRGEDSKNPGEEYPDTASRYYFTSLEGVAEHLFQFTLRKADVESLHELVRIAATLRAEISDAFMVGSCDVEAGTEEAAA